MKEALSTKTKICNASIELFAEKGYVNCGIREIASAVNIKSSSIYNHFSSKDEILKHIFTIFEEEYPKYRTPVDELIEMAKTEPLYEVFQKMFHLTCEEQEYNRMSKMAKIIISMQYENEIAGRLYYKLFIDEPVNYINNIAQGLNEINKIKEFNYSWLSYLAGSFAFMMHHEAFVNEYSHSDIKKKFDPMKNYILKFWEGIVSA